MIRISESRLKTIIKECINETFRTYDNSEHNLIDKLYDMDIDYDYINDNETILEISIENEDIRKMVNNLLNVYGWIKIKEDKYTIYAERRYGDNLDNYIDPDEQQWGIYYHVTPSNKVTKILRQGLTPREGNRLGYNRGERVYLISYPSTDLINDFRSRGDNREYTILKVDLTGLLGKKIHVYQDDFAQEGAVYTYEPIPPQCISVYGKYESNKLDNKINECISDVLYKNNLKGNILMENKSINITNDIRSYMKMSIMGEMGDADMSKSACVLHERLMDMMSLDHLDSNDRISFVRILSFLGKLLKINADVQIYVNGGLINYSIDGKNSYYSIDIEDGPDVYDAIVYRTWDGVVIDDMDYYDYGGGQVSEDIRSAHLTDEIISEIKGMGLVPALYITGSFHEKFAMAIGIIPGETNKLNNEDGIYFDCKK